jgi:hypothetical protein
MIVRERQCLAARSRGLVQILGGTSEPNSIEEHAIARGRQAERLDAEGLFGQGPEIDSHDLPLGGRPLGRSLDVDSGEVIQANEKGEVRRGRRTDLS